MTKYPCIFCHKTTGTANKASAGSKGALQCGVCDLWAHYECTGLAQSTIDAFAVLVQSGDCDKPFKCASCKAALTKVNADLNALKVRLSAIENRQQETVQRVETVEARQVSSDSRMDKMETRLGEVAASSGSSKDVWEELKERERRETNIIIHNVPESSLLDNKERENRDLRGLQKLFNLMEVNLEVSEAVKFIRREGEKQNDQPRPLKVVLRKKEERDLALANAHKLNRCEQEEWRRVTVVSDLTRRQRNEEVDMRKLTASKNLELSREEIDKGEAWKVVGKRGAKRIQLVKLYRDEMVAVTGEVRLREGMGSVSRGGKRGRSPGNSPTHPSNRPRIQPGDFGDREGRADQE